jgi:hypothetical protein
MAAGDDEGAELDAHARYVLDGGTILSSAFEIATKFNKPMSWPGFAWSAAYAPRPAPAQPGVNCAPAVVASEEKLGDEASKVGSFVDALGHYQKVVPCKPQAVPKAYLAACRSRTFSLAEIYFHQIGKDSLAVICLKEGFDPRLPAAQSAPPASGH